MKILKHRSHLVVGLSQMSVSDASLILPCIFYCIYILLKNYLISEKCLMLRAFWYNYIFLDIFQDLSFSYWIPEQLTWMLYFQKKELPCFFLNNIIVKVILKYSLGFYFKWQISMPSISIKRKVIKWFKTRAFYI